VPGTATQSAPQPAGVVSRGHTALLLAALEAGEPAYSDPRFVNSTVWQNRSFYFGEVPGGVGVPGNPGSPTFGLISNAASPYWDLGVLGAPTGSILHPLSSVLTNTTGYSPTNVNTAPAFVASYYNGSKKPTIIPPENNGWGTIGIQVPAAFDEGGNFIRPIFGPLTLTNPNPAPGVPLSASFFGNYHVTSGVNGAALNSVFTVVPDALATDFDRQPRPVNPTQGNPHRGADQKLATTPAPATPLPR
jgi:hypothetical protein